MKRTAGKKTNQLVFVLLFSLFLGLIIWSRHSFWLSRQLTFEKACLGVIKHEQTVKAVFANTETLLFSPAEGTFNYLEEEGRRFRKGEIIAALTPSGASYGLEMKTKEISAPVSGLFYVQTDGLEEVFSPENLLTMDLEKMLAETNRIKVNSVNKKGPVSKNQVIGKIVNNLRPSWAFVYLPSLDGLLKDDIIKFVVEDEEYYARVMRISQRPRGAVVRFSQYITGSTESRIKDIIWRYKSSARGVVVPVSALISKGEEKGVFVVEEGIVRFKNVKLVDQNESYACVENLPEGVQVITNPQKEIEGIPVNCDF